MRLIAPSTEATEEIGGRLARAIPDSIAQALQVQLHGDLGAGKTTFARGFLSALGYGGAVRSPTYTLVEIYALAALTVVHADLYRLQDPEELEGLGLRDLAVADHVWLIEWPERAGSRLPPADLDVTLAACPDHHSVEVRAVTAAGTAWLSLAALVELPGGQS